MKGKEIKLNVYEIETDYTWVCAYTPEGAKKVYMKITGWDESDYEREVNEGDTGVISVDKLKALTNEQLNKRKFIDIETGETRTFKAELARRTKEELFASSEW